MKKVIATLLWILPFTGIVHAQSPVIRVACLGNSITQGSNDANAYPQQLGQLLGAGFQVRNFGVGGRTLLDKGDFPIREEQAYTNALAFIPHILLIKLGTNDSKPQNWIYQTEFVANYLQIINDFRAVNPLIQIYACRPVPVFQDGFGITGSIVENEILTKIDSVLQLAQVETIDFFAAMTGKSGWFPDGIHPNSTGYAWMAAVARDSILSSPSGYIRWFSGSKTYAETGDTIRLFWNTVAGSNPELNGLPVSDSDSMDVVISADSEWVLMTKGEKSYSDTLRLKFIPSGVITHLSAFPVFLDNNLSDSSLLVWKTSSGSTTFLDGKPVKNSDSIWVVPDVTTTYSFSATGATEEQRNLTVYKVPPDSVNRTLGRPAKASSTAYQSDPSFAVDGDPATEWVAGTGVSPWFQVDFGRELQVSQVRINWGTTYSTTFSLQGVTTANQLKNIRAGISSSGGIQDIQDLTGLYRYIRLLSTKSSNTENGIAIREFQVKGYPVVAVSVPDHSAPLTFSVSRNYPNPFNPSTTVQIHLLKASEINYTISAVTGQQVQNHTVSGNAGLNTITLNMASLPSGIYFLKVQAREQTAIRKLALIK